MSFGRRTMRTRHPVTPPPIPDVSDDEHARPPRTRWLLRGAGLALLVAGWLAVASDDFGTWMFVVDTLVFALLGAFAFAAAYASRTVAVNLERKLRLTLLVRNMELENLSTHDELTQLFNRRAFLERLGQEIESARSGRRCVAFVALELGELDYVNRTYGYAAGDEMLAAFGRLLLGYCRATDLPARLSARRFGIILPDTDRRSASAIAGRLADAIDDRSLVASEPDLPVHVALGLAGYPWAGDTSDELVLQAESELAQGGIPFGQSPDDIPAAFRNMRADGGEPEAPTA